MSEFAHFLGRGSGREGAPAVFMAPMSGVTDLGMRQAAESFGANFVVSEMVDAEEYAAGDRANIIKAEGDGIACHIVQVAGCWALQLAEAAKRAEGAGAAVVDINMGCPAKKVVGGLAGSALMRDLELAVGLIRATVAAVSVPVTVKMRLGWDDATVNAPELARRAAAEGIAMITVHGRTRCQFYKGTADWTAIRAVKEAVAIPVVANGDGTSAADAREMLARSGADGVMIGRAAIGRPWLVGAIAADLAGRPPAELSPADKRDAAIAHYTTLLSLFGKARGVRHARKHLAGYATHAGVPADAVRHRELVTCDDPDRVVAMLAAIFDEPELDLAA